MKLEEHFPLQTTNPPGLSLQTSRLFEVNEAHLKGQPATHQDIQPLLLGGKWLLQLSDTELLYRRLHLATSETLSNQAWPPVNQGQSTSESPSSYLLQHHE